MLEDGDVTMVVIGHLVVISLERPGKGTDEFNFGQDRVSKNIIEGVLEAGTYCKPAQPGASASS